jgi:hypothetical protein
MADNAHKPESSADSRPDELTGIPAAVLEAIAEMEPVQADAATADPEQSNTDDATSNEPEASAAADAGAKAQKATADVAKGSDDTASSKQDGKGKAGTASDASSTETPQGKAAAKAGASKKGTDKADASTGGDKGQGADGQPPATDWREGLAKADLDELRQHPRINAVVGEMVDKGMAAERKELRDLKNQVDELRRQLQDEAQSAREDAKRELAEQARLRQLDAMAEADPEHPLSQDHLQQREEARRKAYENALRQEGHGAGIDRGRTEAKTALESWLQTLPQEEQDAYSAAITGKQYDGDYVRSFGSWAGDALGAIAAHRTNGVREAALRDLHDRLAGLADDLPEEEAGSYRAVFEGKTIDPDVLVSMVDALAQARAAADRSAWEADEREALRKELLGELNGDEPSPAVGSGPRGSAAPRKFSLKDIEDMPWEEFEKKEDEILDGLFTGALS